MYNKLISVSVAGLSSMSEIEKSRNVKLVQNFIYDQLSIVANLLQAPLNMILFTISIYICNNKCRHMINIQTANTDAMEWRAFDSITQLQPLSSADI